MTSQHQTERTFTFSPDELKWLLTTQRIAETRATRKLSNSQAPSETFVTTVDDLIQFGRYLREAAEQCTTTLTIKLGVVFWLTAVWMKMYNEPIKTPKPIEGFETFIRSQIHDMHLRLLKDYIDNAYKR